MSYRRGVDECLEGKNQITQRVDTSDTDEDFLLWNDQGAMNPSAKARRITELQPQTEQIEMYKESLALTVDVFYVALIKVKKSIDQ